MLYCWLLLLFVILGVCFCLFKLLLLFICFVVFVNCAGVCLHVAVAFVCDYLLLFMVIGLVHFYCCVALLRRVSAALLVAWYRCVYLRLFD